MHSARTASSLARQAYIAVRVPARLQANITSRRTFVMSASLSNGASAPSSGDKPPWENVPSASLPSKSPSIPSSSTPTSTSTSDCSPSIPASLFSSGWTLSPSATGAPALVKTYDFAGKKGKELRGERRKAWSAGVKWLKEEVTPVTDRFNHHPDVAIESFSKLRLTLFTHVKNRLTTYDLQLAEAIDALPLPPAAAVVKVVKEGGGEKKLGEVEKAIEEAEKGVGSEVRLMAHAPGDEGIRS